MVKKREENECKRTIHPHLIATFHSTLKYSSHALSPIFRWSYFIYLCKKRNLLRNEWDDLTNELCSYLLNYFILIFELLGLLP